MSGFRISAITTGVAILVVAQMLSPVGVQSAAPVTTAVQVTPPKPHIVTIMLDDLDVLTLEAIKHLDATYATNVLPNFKKYFRDQAVEFTESYTTNPLCCPSRATFLTGQYSHNNHTLTNQGSSGSVLGLDDPHTLPVWMQQAGYYTAHVGKYLNGYGSFIKQNSVDGITQSRASWDAEVGYANRMNLEPNYVPPGWNSWAAAIDPLTYCTYNYTLNQNGTLFSYLKDGQIRRLDDPMTYWGMNGDLYNASVPANLPPHYGTADNYQTDVYTLRALDAIQDAHTNHPGQPLFLTVMPLTPHVESCNFTNAKYARTSAADTGPLTNPINYAYKNLFKEVIRSRSQDSALLASVKQLASTYLEYQAPDFAVPKTSFNEFDVTDKPVELQQKLPLLDTSDISSIQQQFAARVTAIKAVDDLIGAVFYRLQEYGMLGNTIVIFTSDNGFLYGQHRASNKQLAYEESARVPLFIRLPSALPMSTARAALNNDLALTISEFGGATPDISVDGRSLVPLLADPNTTNWRKQFLVEHFRGLWPDESMAVIEWNALFAVKTTSLHANPDWKYIEQFPGMQYKTGYFRNKPELDSLGFPIGTPTSAWIWQTSATGKEIYDTRSDRFEVTNLLAVPLPPVQQKFVSQLAASLKAKLANLVSCGTSVGTKTCFDAENQ